MPASSSALPAGCIFGLSFFEPMMIPTRGSSTSISSKASSTAGIVTPAGRGSEGSLAAPLGWGSSEISLTWFLPGCWSTGDALDGAGGDVGADLHSLEGDPAGSIVCAIACLGRRRAEARHVQYPPARGNDLAVALSRPRVGHFGDLGRLGEAVDDVALRGGLGVAGRGEDHGHRPLVAELRRGAGEAAGLAGGEEEL